MINRMVGTFAIGLLVGLLVPRDWSMARFILTIFSSCVVWLTLIATIEAAPIRAIARMLSVMETSMEEAMKKANNEAEHE